MLNLDKSLMFYVDFTPRIPEVNVREHGHGEAVFKVRCSFLTARLHPAL